MASNQKSMLEVSTDQNDAPEVSTNQNDTLEVSTTQNSSLKVSKKQNGTPEVSSVEHGSFAELTMQLVDLEYTDKKAFTIVKQYYQRVNEEAEEYIKLLRDKFDPSDVTWSPPWYQDLDCYLTRPPPKEPPDEEEMYLTGPMKKQEKDIIKESWEALVKKYNIPDRPDLLAKWRSKRIKIQSLEKARVIVMAFLARKTKRSIYQVYKEFCSIYGIKQKYSGYTPLEEMVMKICFHHDYKKSVVLLQIILDRDPRGLYLKRDLFNKRPTETSPAEKKKAKKKKTDWTLELAETFLRSLLKRSAMPLKALKGAKFKKSVWADVELDTGIPRDHLQKFWLRTLHVQLFAKQKVLLHEVRRKVFEIVKQSSEYEVWGDISWALVARHFSSAYTTHFLRHTAGFWLWRDKTINMFETPLRKVLKYAKRNAPVKKTKLRLVSYNPERGLRYRSAKQNTKDDNDEDVKIEDEE